MAVNKEEILAQIKPGKVITAKLLTDMTEFAEAQTGVILDEITGKDVISAPEIILARNGEADLKARLDKEHQEANAQLAKTNNDISFSANKVTYYAHRGAESHVPENTIKAFEVAHQLGFDGIELDTMCTADNEWVVMHDTTVDRMTDGTGTVNTMTLTEIQALTVNGGNFSIWHIGLKVPLLYDALVFAKNKGLKVLVEIKNSTTEQLVNLGNMISRLGMTETAIVLAPYGMANTLTSINSPLKLFVFYSSDSGFTTTLDNNRNIIGVSFNYPQITQPLIDEMHARGKLVNAWTIIRNDTAEMCSKMGVDSITGGVYNA